MKLRSPQLGLRLRLTACLLQILPLSLRHYPKLLVGLLMVMGIGSLTAQPSLAAQFTYVADPISDSLDFDPNGLNGIGAGGTIFEISGMAIKDDPDTDSLWFAFGAKLPVYGKFTGPFDNGFPISNENIGFGDLLLDFSGLGSLKAASDAGQLYAIRFATGNDSESNGIPIGVFENVQAKSVASANAGWWNLFYNNRNVVLRGQPAAQAGELAWNDPYYTGYTADTRGDRSTQMVNVIREGTGAKIGELAMMSAETLASTGFDLNQLLNGGSAEEGYNVFGFRIARSLLPIGDFIATLVTECVNDMVALVSELATPPTPPPSPNICPLLEGQLNPWQPSRIVNGIKVFENVDNGLWYDPPGTMGYTYQAVGDTTFLAINDFPCGIADPTSPSPAAAAFAVLVNGQVYGAYYPGEKIDFTALFPNGVTEFTILGLETRDGQVVWGPLIDPFALPIQLSQPTSNSFNVIPLEDLVIPDLSGRIPTSTDPTLPTEPTPPVDPALPTEPTLPTDPSTLPTEPTPPTDPSIPPTEPTPTPGTPIPNPVGRIPRGPDAPRSVPEPSAIAGLGAALSAFVLGRRKKKHTTR